MTGALLSLRDVHTHIAQYHILHGIELTVPRGGITMLLGRNGAGKTTTLRTILGLWKASRGSVIFDSRDITKLSTPQIARLGIGYVPEDMGIFALLTVRENMEVAARSGSMNESRLEWLLEIFPALKKFWNTMAGGLSGGQRQMLSIARALIEPRKLILIDEPTKGLAPAIIQHMIYAFQQLKRTDTTVLMVEQNFYFASSLGDYVAVIDDGKVVYDGMMTDLSANEALQTKLLKLNFDSHR